MKIKTDKREPAWLPKKGGHRLICTECNKIFIGDLKKGETKSHAQYFLCVYCEKKKK